MNIENIKNKLNSYRAEEANNDESFEFIIDVLGEQKIQLTSMLIRMDKSGDTVPAAIMGLVRYGMLLERAVREEQESIDQLKELDW